MNWPPLVSEISHSGDGLEGRYELLDRLGEGGFAVVYRARQLSTGQLVAIKVMRRHADGTEEDRRSNAARFRREMGLLSQLRHPHIVRLIDAGSLDDGRTYIATDLVEGQTLADLASARGPLPLAELRPWMLQVLDALAAAHGRGLVHRDIKPHNVMISAGGLVPHATLLDFGVATIAEGHRPEGFEALTVSGTLVGTLGYMAPELLAGAPAGPATDLFAWGLVLLECLTGDSAFGGRPPPAIAAGLLSPQPIPIPAEIAVAPIGALLSSVLDKDPTRRPQSAAEVYRRLERCPVDLATRTVSDLPRPQIAVLAFAFEAMGEAETSDAVRQALSLLRAQGGTVLAEEESAFQASFGARDGRDAATAALRFAAWVHGDVTRGAQQALVLRAAVHVGRADPDSLKRLLLTTRRMVSLTTSNAVWVTDPVRALAGPAFEMRPVGEWPLPGQSGRMAVYALEV